MGDNINTIYIYVRDIPQLKRSKLMRDIKNNIKFEYLDIGSKMTNKGYRTVKDKRRAGLVVIHKYNKKYNIITIYNTGCIEEIKIDLIETLKVLEDNDIQVEFIGYVNNPIKIDTKIKQVYLGYKGDKCE